MGQKLVIMIGFDALINLLRGETVESQDADLIPSNEISDARETVNKQIIQLIAIYRKQASRSQ